MGFSRVGRILAHFEELFAFRLFQLKSIRRNRLIEGSFGDTDLQLVIVARTRKTNLPRIVHVAKSVPAAVADIGADLPAGIVGLPARDTQIGAVYPYLLRNLPIGSRIFGRPLAHA